MTRNILFELFFFMLPFVAYAIFRYATRNVRDPKRAWPMNALFLLGVAFAIGGWIILIMLQPPKDRNVCHDRPQFIDGKIVQASDYECERDVSDTGRPKAKVDEGESATEAVEDEIDSGGVTEEVTEEDEPERR